MNKIYMNALSDFNVGSQIKECETSLVSTSLLDNLKKDLSRRENQINDIKNAIKFLEENPQFEEFSKLITKIR